MKLKNWLRSNANLAFLVIAVMVLIFGCEVAPKRSVSRDKVLLARLEALRREYLTNSAAEAKLSMLHALSILTTIPDPARTDGTWLAYARLFCIESMVGDSKQASIYFEKARYWIMILHELQGRTVSETLRDLDVFSKEKCKSLMLEWDTQATGGRGPRYYRDALQNRSTPP
jgi:hypothetical protein